MQAQKWRMWFSLEQPTPRRRAPMSTLRDARRSMIPSVPILALFWWYSEATLRCDLRARLVMTGRSFELCPRWPDTLCPTMTSSRCGREWTRWAHIAINLKNRRWSCCVYSARRKVGNNHDYYRNRNSVFYTVKSWTNLTEIFCTYSVRSIVNSCEILGNLADHYIYEHNR